MWVPVTDKLSSGPISTTEGRHRVAVGRAEGVQRPLDSFWPAGGPVWDGLARTSFGTSVLIEAKSHVSEMVSTCDATSDDSRAMIRAAFDEAKKVMSVHASLGVIGQLPRYVHDLFVDLNGGEANVIF